jgi:hypothetical protein
MQRLDPRIEHAGEEHDWDVERITIEPFNLRDRPRYSLVIDRLAHWYWVPREWLKKVALMDDVYLFNNPFTFQSMEKHAAYCAMMRLGLNVPATWLIPHKRPPANPRFPDTAARYNRPFRLEEVAEQVGYPLYMKPFDGGAWVGVSRIASDSELHRNYDESGGRLMHLQAGIENFEVFARVLSIGAETLVIRYDPARPLHDRYRVEHDFLSPEVGSEAVTTGRVVNSFFRWEFNSCEVIVKDGVVYPIDYANASPDSSIVSLHYYFPWVIKTLAKWAVFCTAGGRRMTLDMDTRRYFEVAGRDDLSQAEKLAAYGRLAEEYLETERYREFCDAHLAHVDEVMVSYIESPAFDDLLVRTVCDAFPPHEHEGFVAHDRGLLRAWATDQRAAARA